VSQFGGGGPPRGPGGPGPYPYGQGGPPQYPQQQQQQQHYGQQQPYPPPPPPPKEAEPEEKKPVGEKKSRTITLAAGAALLVVVLLVTVWLTYGVQYRAHAETTRIVDQALSSQDPTTVFVDATDDESKDAAKVVHDEGLKIPTFSSDTGNYGTDKSRGAICYRGQAGPKTVHLIVTHAGYSGSNAKIERMSATRSCKCRTPPPKAGETRHGVQCDFWK